MDTKTRQTKAQLAAILQDAGLGAPERLMANYTHEQLEAKVAELYLVKLAGVAVELPDSYSTEYVAAARALLDTRGADELAAFAELRRTRRWLAPLAH